MCLSYDSLPLPFSLELFFPKEDQSLGLKFIKNTKTENLFLHENKVEFADIFLLPPPRPRLWLRRAVTGLQAMGNFPLSFLPPTVLNPFHIFRHLER